MRKIGILCLAIVLAIGATGIGFAKWFETLKIEGVIMTGEVDVQLSQMTNDPSPTGLQLGDIYDGSLDPSERGGWTYDPTGGPVWQGARYDKNVGAIDCQLLVDQGRLTDPYDNGPNVILVTVSNAYPSYHGSLAFDIENIGTIPVKVESILLREVSEGDTVVTLQDPVHLVPGDIWYVSIDEDAGTALVETDVDEPDEYEFSIRLSDLRVGTQIDPTPEQDMVIYGDVDVHVEQSAEELETYDFQIEIVCSQWNEVF